MNEMSLMGSFARPWPFNELHNKNNTQPHAGPWDGYVTKNGGMHCNIRSPSHYWQKGKGST